MFVNNLQYLKGWYANYNNYKVIKTVQQNKYSIRKPKTILHKKKPLACLYIINEYVKTRQLQIKINY